jgi:hypothetical protein
MIPKSTPSNTQAAKGKGVYNCGPSSSTPATSNATPKGLDMTLSFSSSSPSPNRRAKSHTACVQLSTLNGSS